MLSLLISNGAVTSEGGNLVTPSLTRFARSFSRSSKSKKSNRIFVHGLASLARSLINHGNKSVFVSFLIGVLLSLRATQEALEEQLSPYRAWLDEQLDTTVVYFL